MTTHIALLRGVSPGGQKPIAAETFVDLLGELGFADARAVGGANNLVFDSPERTGADLQNFLETEINTRLGLRTDIYVRTAQAWAAIIAANPYAEFAQADPGLLMTLFLKDPPDKKVIGALRAKLTEGELELERERDRHGRLRRRPVQTGGYRPAARCQFRVHHPRLQGRRSEFYGPEQHRCRLRVQLALGLWRRQHAGRHVPQSAQRKPRVCQRGHVQRDADGKNQRQLHQPAYAPGDGACQAHGSFCARCGL